MPGIVTLLPADNAAQDWQQNQKWSLGRVVVRACAVAARLSSSHLILQNKKGESFTAPSGYLQQHRKAPQHRALEET